MTLRFYLSSAWRSLRRGGQRSALAVVCVAFGVLSLVALQQLAHMISDAMLVSPRLVEGGDLVLSWPDGEAITPEDLAGLDSLDVTGVSPHALGRAMWLKTPESGRATLVTRVLGVDPERFPLYGEIELQAPKETSAKEALSAEGAAVITRDLARRFDLAIGDTLSLFGSPRTPPFQVDVAGIAAATPSRRGLGVFVSLETTSRRGAGGITSVAVRHEDPGSVAQRLERGGWAVRVVPKTSGTDEAEIFGFMLPAAGILGLLLGGIGVANTMQVLLARRRQEIATLKTLGYRQPHLLLLFGIEAALLGVIGGAVGTGIGVVLSNVLMRLSSESMPYLLDFGVRPGVVAGGLLVGVLTALIFGLVAIVQASHVRPATLLRDAPIRTSGGHRAATLGLYAVLLGVFGGLSGVVLGSLPKGFGVVAAGLVGLLVLGAVLGVVLLLVVRIPAPGLPLLGMARRNLRHQPLRSIYGLVALFVGVVAIGFATISLANAREQMRARQIDLGGINIRVYAASDDLDSLGRAIERAGAIAHHTDHALDARVFDAQDTLQTRVTHVFARSPEDLRWNLVLRDSASVAPASAAYLVDRAADHHGLEVGDTVRVRGARDDELLVLAGIFETGGGLLDIGAPPGGLIVPLEVGERIGRSPRPVQVSVAAPTDRVGEVAGAIGRELPQTVVIGKDALREAVNRLFTGLFWFVVAVAGLALVAGAVLIANSVGLSMLERRRELGVLKAIGYSSGQVLGTVLLENVLLGAIGGTLGVAGVQLTVLVVNQRFSAANLTLSVPAAMALVVVAVLFAAVAALLVAWRPAHVRPLEVLRGE